MNQNCDICTNKLTLPIQLACKHIFCYLCIKSIYKTNPRCPTCNVPIINDIDNLNENNLFTQPNNIKNNQINWLYSGATDGWWYFDDNTTSILEQEYQTFIKQDDDVASTITIGNQKYIIDYENNLQINKNDPNKRRHIKRVDNDDAKKLNIKGKAGIYYKQ